MNLLKKIFGGGSDSEDKDGLYFYIRSNQTGEVIPVRLHRYNDLSASDDFQSFYAHKTIVGQKSFDRIEAQFEFDKKRSLVNAEISGGTLVDREAYEAYRAGQQASGGAG